MKDGQENEQRRPTAAAGEPHRTGPRAKIVIGGVTVLIAALLVWSFIAHREAGEAGEGGVAVSASHVAREGDEAAIVLDADAASMAGIATTVQRWDPADTSSRIELAVGRDLQFIRINGTVVGGLVGLVIYSLGQLFR